MKPLFLTFIFVSFLFSCGEENSVNPPQNNQLTCDQTTVTDATEFANTVAYNEVSSLSFNQNCMMIDYSGSGCDGSSWVLTLVTDGQVDYTTNPVSRKLKLGFENQEMCLAYFYKQKTFDVSSLQVPGHNSVQLILENTPLTITYQY